MVWFTIKRLLWMIPVVLGILFLVFTLSYYMPGDPVVNLIGTEYTQEQYDAKAAELGLDQPFFKQFVDYVVGVVTKFDLGTSYSTKRSVTTMIFERLGTTLKLGIFSCIISIIISMPLGIISATHQYSGLDYSVTTISIVFASIPGFWLAMMLMIVFSLKLGWLPSSGIGSFKNFILPIAAQSLTPLASITRMTRSSMLEVIRQDYIRTARAKGLKERAITMKHALKNALIPVITVVGMQMSIVVGGSVVIESIFSLPGTGTLLVTAINNRDYPTIMGVVVVLSLTVCLINLLVDLVYAAVDPRIKAQFSSSGRIGWISVLRKYAKKGA